MRSLADVLEGNAQAIGKVVDFDFRKDKLLHLDFTQNKHDLSEETLKDTSSFSTWVDDKLINANAKYGIGGYNEHRTIYNRSVHFTEKDEPRRLHLGVDIWGKVSTPIYNFYEAKVHSFANNDCFGDYGATIILEYWIDKFTFYVIYGHLNASALTGLAVGKIIPKGQQFASFGNENENGSWPPHLHLQFILDIGHNHGDYPGVCKYSEREQYLANCPNPESVLRHSFGVIDKEFYS